MNTATKSASACAELYYRVTAPEETLCYDLWEAHEPYVQDHFAGITQDALHNHLRAQVLKARRANDTQIAEDFDALRRNLVADSQGLSTRDHRGVRMQIATLIPDLHSRPDPNLRRQAMDRGERPGSDIAASR